MKIARRWRDRIIHDGNPAMSRAAQNGDVAANGQDPQVERDWVARHVGEVSDVIQQFLGGDGLSLEGKIVLDVGCGDGLIDWGIATKLKPRELVGVDLELTDRDALLHRLRAQGLAQEGLPRNLRFAVCREDSLMLPDASFDWVISWSAFEHIHDPVTVAKEVRRVLRPGGLFFVQVFPFFLSEHGSHLEEWFPEGFAHKRPLDEIARRLSPTFAGERRIEVRTVGHARHGNKQPGDVMLWDYLNLNRISLDDLHRALLQAGFWVSKVEALAPSVHLPREQNFRSLAEMLIAGIKLIAVPATT